ncbi:MAG: hypothetical protein M1592_04690 [Candidatus Thermoplasmatota archaeon]|nr:hypothetical protein [Candidatus Thermoplasmatota archaeon]WMT45126.1 MAG: hypothetical protein RE469_02765 [Cuniculiplasma divulgatum]
MRVDSELREFMLKFYENLIYGMLKSSFTTDDRVSDSYLKLSDEEKRELEKELERKSKFIASDIVEELITHDLLIESEPTTTQALEIEKIIRKVISDYAED